MKKFYSMWIRSWTCVSQSIASSTIVRPPPCTTRCIFKVHITYFISDSVAIGRRFNAGSKKEDCTLSSGSIHTFSYQNVSKKQPPPPLTHFVNSCISTERQVFALPGLFSTWSSPYRMKEVDSSEELYSCLVIQG